MIEKLLIESKRTDFPYFGSGNGDGIVYVGGGKYWPMIVAGIRVLRDTGCNLPVEVWYRGDCEKVYPSDIEGLNVTCVNIDTISRELGDWNLSRGDASKGGWEAKLYAIYHTNFDRILFLDADAYCVENPEPLFKVLDKFPVVFWRDLPKQDNVIRWDDVYPKGKATKGSPVQGGQLLFDRIKSKQEISLANWMCQNSTYYFKLMYGDQDTWRVAFSVFETKTLCLDSIKWVQGIMFDCKYDGKSFIFHRCQGKLFAPSDIPKGNQKYTNPIFSIPREYELFTYFADAVNARNPPATSVFTEVFKRRLWGPDCVSGVGSTEQETRPFVDVINRWIKKYEIKSLVDAGCGNGLTGSLLNIEAYIGLDVVEDLIRENESKYPRLSYTRLDILTEYDIIGNADCLLCKDVLHHWPNVVISDFFDNLIRSKKFKYLVFVFDSANAKPNTDCHIGGYRSLKITDEKFSKLELIEYREIRYKTVAILMVGDNVSVS